MNATPVAITICLVLAITGAMFASLNLRADSENSEVRRTLSQNAS